MISVLFWAAGQPAPRQRQRTSRLSVSPEPSYRHNLPTPLTSFIGRERELADVQARLTGARLVTLTGVGGCGKTRLALEVARAVLDRYPDGVWLVELAALADPALVPQTVGRGVQHARDARATDRHRTCHDACEDATCCWSWTTASTCSTPALS